MHIFNEQAGILAGRLDKFAEQPNQTHSLYPYISACTLDIIAGLLNSSSKVRVSNIYFFYFFQKRQLVHMQTLN
jgi:hypothetical protein